LFIRLLVYSFIRLFVLVVDTLRLLFWQTIFAGGPGTKIAQLAALGAKRTKRALRPPTDGAGATRAANDFCGGLGLVVHGNDQEALIRKRGCATSSR
jgi:hypothetical protein